MITIENFENGKTINKEIATQYLLGETIFKGEEGEYIVDFQQEDEKTSVTIDFNRKCIFNEIWEYDFTFQSFLDELHRQNLEEIEEQIYDFIIEKAEIENQ